MPSRKKATLRSLRSTEAALDHCNQRDKAHTKFCRHVDAAARSGMGHQALLAQLEQLRSELDTALRVAARHHELAMQQLHEARFPDEDPN